MSKPKLRANQMGPVASRRELLWGLFFVVLLFFGLAALGLRLYRLQVTDHEHYRTIALKQHRRKQDLEPRRGDIYMQEDGRNVLVAGSVDRHSLLIHGRQRDPEALVAGLSEILHLDAHERSELRRRVGSGKAFWYRRRQVSHHEASVIRKSLKTLERDPENPKKYKAQLEGVEVSEDPVRLYPFGSLGSHILGLVGIDGAGLCGVEKSFDEQLKGLRGLEEFEIDNRRRQLANLNSVMVPAMPGYSVVLTIDRRIQAFAEAAADKAWDHWKPASLSVVAVEPSTGRILALVSRPNFNPEDISKTPPENLRNRLLTDPYEPGSTIKPLFVSRAWQLGRGHPERPIELPRTLSVAGRRKPIEDSHKVSVKERETRECDVIVQSSNVGSYLVSSRLDDSEFVATLRDFGLGQETGIPLSGECAGNLALTRKLTAGSRAALAQGYGLLVTPLQMVLSYAAIANGGMLYRPRIVDALLDPDGEVAKRFEPIPVARVLDSKVALEWMRPAMAGVVESPYGTAKRTRIKEYSMAGKTGTSKKLVPADHNPKVLVYSPSRTVCSFVGFSPVEDPKIAIAVVVDDPTREHGRVFGGNVAAPVAAEVVRQSLRYMGVPTRPDPDAKEEKGGQRVSQKAVSPARGGRRA